MDIHNMHINAENVTISDKIGTIVYNQDFGISKEQFSELIAGIKGLAADKQHMIEHDFREMSQAAGEQEKESIAEKIRTFLIANAVPVAHSLTATAIFELGRILA